MIEYEERFRQRILFDGMKYERNIRPTDIDFMLDFNGNILMAEIKCKGLSITKGQEIAFCNMAKRFVGTDKKFLALYCTHETSTDKDVIAADTQVEMYLRSYGDKALQFQTDVIGWTLKEAVDYWINAYGISKGVYDG
jgi:hypothetical protein